MGTSFFWETKELDKIRFMYEAFRYSADGEIAKPKSRDKYLPDKGLRK
jgi:hypothetical protein